MSASTKNPPDQRVLSDSMSFSNVQTAKRFLATGPPFTARIVATERDIAIVRRGFTYDQSNFASFGESDPPTFDSAGDNHSYNYGVNLGWAGGKIPGSAKNDGWFISIIVGVDMVIQDFNVDMIPPLNGFIGGGASFSTQPSELGAGDFLGTGTVTLIGHDGKWNEDHEYTVLGGIFGQAYTGADYPEVGSSGVTSVACNLTIEALTFHDWRDQHTGQPTYNSANGQVLNPF